MQRSVYGSYFVFFTPFHICSDKAGRSPRLKKTFMQRTSSTIEPDVDDEILYLKPKHDKNSSIQDENRGSFKRGACTLQARVVM